MRARLTDLLRPERRTGLVLAAILLAAFTLRLAYRVHLGSHDFWQNGYRFFYPLAVNLAHGKGLVSNIGEWAKRQPIYPMFLTPSVWAGRNYLFVVIPQALLGALTVACAFLIGRRFFGDRAGLIAALLTAIYPYYLVHDTALQDTCLTTAGATLAVYVLLRARTSGSIALWLVGGALLGLTVLIRGTLLPFALGAVAWIAFMGEGPVRRRLMRTGAVGLACVVVMGVWMVRNEVRIGRPVLSSEAGAEFWKAHDALTFSHYPTGSVDESARASLLALSDADKQTLHDMKNEMDRSDWYQARGLSYVKQHPMETLAGTWRKEAAGFSWILNPVKSPGLQAVYFVSYTPILILGLLGMGLAWRQWREHSLIYLQFAGFVVVTAIYWAHTSHRSYLDVYLIIFTAAVIDRLIVRVRSRHVPRALPQQPEATKKRDWF